MDVLYAREMFARGPDGDFQLQYQSGVPWRVVTYSNPFRATVTMRQWSGFVKDSWELGDRLTLNLGVRFDRYSAGMDEQERPGGTFSTPATFQSQDFITWSAFQPRAAVSYALTADKRTVLKATYGRFGYFINADYGLPYNPNALVKETFLWSDLNRNNTYDSGEEGTLVSRTGGTSRVLNSDLKQPAVHEATATVERQIRSSFSARASYVYKREYDLYQLVNIGRPYDVFNRPITTTDPGPDGLVGSADDGGPITYYDYAASLRPGAFDTSTDLNTPGYSDSWHNFELVLSRRLADRWQFLTTMLITKNNMWQTRDFADSVTTTSGVPVNPNVEAFFPKNQTTDYTFKVSGSYLMPWDILAAATYTQSSGTRYARTARFTTGLQGQTQVTLPMEETGSQKLDDLSLLSLRAEKRVKLGSGQASFQFDLFNALNSNVATQVVGRSGATYGRILSILPPRIGRVGVTFSF